MASPQPTTVQPQAQPRSATFRPRYRTHVSYTAMFLIVSVLLIAFWSLKMVDWYPLSPDPLVSNLRMALITITLLFMFVCMLYLPDGLITRPSQLLWKAVTGLSMVYLMILIIFLFLTKPQTQWLLQSFFDRTLGTPLPQHSYATDCRLYIPNSSTPFKNLTDTFLDVFVLAHLIGWFVKTLICRDLKLVLFQSVFFELLQVMCRHLLPNFYECWWDHVVLDVMGMNLLGIVAGWWVIKRWNLERLKWSMREGPLKKGIGWNARQFVMSGDVSQVEYKMMTNTKKFLQVSWFIIFMPLADLTFFFNKFLLNIPPAQYINAIRIWMMGLLCINASKQYYAYITRREKEMRINVLLAQFIVLLEIVLFVKNYAGEFRGIECPLYAQVLIGFFVGTFLLCLLKILYSDLVRYWQNRHHKPIKQQ